MSVLTPIVLLHGVGLDRTIWDEVATNLTSTGREVVALDLPGHGAEPPLTREVSLQDLADDVLARMPEQPVHLVGFSLGALIAQHITAFHPERVRSLVCVSSVCARTPDESAAVQSRLETAGEDFQVSAERALERWFPDDLAATSDTAVDPVSLRERTRRILLANDIPSYLHAYRVFALGDKDIADELHRIEVPTLAVTGEHDPGSTPEMSHRIAERVPGASVHIIPAARHMVPNTHPELLSQLIRDLTDSAEATENTTTIPPSRGARHD